MHVGARHARVLYVAADHHAQARKIGAVAAQRQGVEQALGGMCVVAVAGVEYAGLRMQDLRDIFGRARFPVAHYERVAAHRFQRVDRIAERFALGRGGAADIEIDGVRAKTLGGQVERGARARRWLEEKIDDGAATQDIERAAAAGGLFAQRFGAIEQGVDGAGRQTIERQQVTQPALRVGLRRFAHRAAELEVSLSQVSTITCAAIASSSLAFLRRVWPRARRSAKRCEASIELRRSSTICTGRW